MYILCLIHYKKQELFNSSEYLSSLLVFGVVCVVYLFSFLYCVFWLFVLSLSCVLCTQCTTALPWFVCFVFVLCLVYPMYYSIAMVCLFCLCPVSCVPNVLRHCHGLLIYVFITSVSGFSILDCPLRFI
jgi:hypothetical protein